MTVLTRDHVIPRRMRGPTTKWNIVLACGPCNFKKGHLIYVDHCTFCTIAQQTYLGSLHILAEETRFTPEQLNRWYNKNAVYDYYAPWREKSG